MRNLARIIFAVLLTCISTLTFAQLSDTSTAKTKKLKIYISASLFNVRETRFNYDLATSLEKQGYQVTLPQRDGFEFDALLNLIDKQLPENKRLAATANMIYLLNMGKLIPESDVVLANLDQPTDEGVVVELTYAHLIGKPVIGLRTDLRAPSGVTPEIFNGVHSFVASQCNAIVEVHDQVRDQTEENAGMQRVTSALIEQLKLIKPNNATLPAYALANPEVDGLIRSASILFDGVDNTHKNDNIDKVVKRFFANKDKLENLISSLRFG